MPGVPSPFARLMVLVVAIALAGCGASVPGPGSASVPSERATSGPSGRPPAAASPTAEPASRSADLRVLLERLTELHPDPFVGEGPAAFEARVAELAGRADSLSEDEFTVELMRLLGGRDRDGHTGLLPFAQDGPGVEAWPLALYWFDEGLYVVDALEPYRAVVGSRVIEIGGRPVTDVVELVTPLISRDNTWTVRARLPGYLVVPGILRGLDLLPTGEAALTLERDGVQTALTPDTVPMGEWVAWRNVFYPLVPPTLPSGEDGPRYLQNPAEHFWSEIVDDALYIAYNQVQPRTASGETIAELGRIVASALEEGAAARVIVDIRGNPGGDNFTYPPLRDALIAQAAAKPGSVIVLIGRSTFSAAGNFATELRAAPGVRFVGEPTGAAPNIWGDAREVILPFSGLVVHIATRAWEFAPDDDALSVEPDVPVAVRWSDHANGIDAALEAALAD